MARWTKARKALVNAVTSKGPWSITPEDLPPAPFSLNSEADRDQMLLELLLGTVAQSTNKAYARGWEAWTRLAKWERC